MLELTLSKVITIFDIPLGFRHGPKSIIDDTTLIVMDTNTIDDLIQYEKDLIQKMSA